MFVALIFLGVAAVAQTPAATPQKTMPISELRVRMHAISEMVQTGQLQEADQAIATLRLEAGNEPLIDGLEAFLLYRRHQYSPARELLTSALKTPDSPLWWRVLLSMCMYAMGDEAVAHDTITRAKTEDPRGAVEAMNAMGVAAMHDFNQAPTVEGALTLSFLVASIGNKRVELNNLDSALRKFPKEPRLVVMRLNLLADASDSKTTLEDTDRAVTVLPDSEIIQATAGELYARFGNFEKAITALKTAVRLNPKDYTAKVNLGGAYQHEQKLPEAEKQYGDLLAATDPPPTPDQMVAAYAGLGSVLTDMKRWKEAEDSLQKGMAINAEATGVINNLAWLYATADGDVRDPKKAIELATKAVTQTRGRLPSVLDTLAEAYFADGQKEKAVETEKKAVVQAPAREDLKQHLAKYEGNPKPAAPADPPKKP